MSRILVRHRGPLEGVVQVPGAKNSVLKLMAATLLADGEYVITNVPDIVDVGIMAELLAHLGVETQRPVDRPAVRNRGRAGRCSRGCGSA